MKEHIQYEDASAMLTDLVHPVDAERLKLDACGMRVLAQSVQAACDVPPFDRSPYDGYAFRAEDTMQASPEHPAVLRILEEVPAGAVPSCRVTAGTAVKILTGAPIPEGADAVVMYEKTSFTDTEVSISAPASPGENIIYAGEDVKKGQQLASEGMTVDAGLAGVLAFQGIAEPLVYRRPVIGIISTGSELVELTAEGEQNLPAGKIRNSIRYLMAAALKKDGCDPVYLGKAGDDAEAIAVLIRKGLAQCDLIILTGGVSAGDYDLTPAAMEQAGCELLFHGVKLKPGMACCYGTCQGKLVCALFGNPASALTNYYAVLRPAVRKLSGRVPYEPERIRVTLTRGFKKKSGQVRMLKGRLLLADGIVKMEPAAGQGNVMIGSSAGCDVIAIVPAGSGALEEGTQLEAFLV